MSLIENPILDYMQKLRDEEKEQEKKLKEPAKLPGAGFLNGIPLPETKGYLRYRVWWPGRKPYLGK